MFNTLFNQQGQLIKAEERSDKREKQFQREQNIISQTAHPSADHSYREEQDKKSDLLKWQQDLDDEILSLVQTLRGMAYNGEAWIQVRNPPLCNDVFIYEVVIPQARPFFSRNLINSNLEETNILKMLRNTMNDIADAMADAWIVDTSAYGIKFTDHDLVMRLIKNAIQSGPYRALKGWTKKTDNAQHKRIEMSSDSTNEPTQKKMLGFINT